MPKPSAERIQDQEQKRIAENLGVPWDRYRARATEGIAMVNARPIFSRKLSVGFQWPRRRDPNTSIPTPSELIASTESHPMPSGPFIEADPFQAATYSQRAADEAIGMYCRYRFLGERAVQIRGMRGWEPVRAANGDPVKLAGMILSRKPADAKRNTYTAWLPGRLFKKLTDREPHPVYEADALELPTDLIRFAAHLRWFRFVLAVVRDRGRLGVELVTQCQGRHWRSWTLTW